MINMLPDVVAVSLVELGAKLNNPFAAVSGTGMVAWISVDDSRGKNAESRPVKE